MPALVEVLDSFELSYVETMVWSSTDENGANFDSSEYADTEFADETIARIKQDCAKCRTLSDAAFDSFNAQSDDYPINSSQYHVAHDFWLTRNHHGAGFWDGDYPEPLATTLTDLAHAFSEQDLYIGEDGKFYLA
jgi:hypothetical protein